LDISNTYVTKEFTFEAAHMLPFYDGGCSSLHGHSYRCQVEVKSAEVMSGCMVIDFHTLKEIVEDNILSLMDHATLLGTSPLEGELLIVLKRSHLKVCLIGRETTAENLCQFIYDKLYLPMYEAGVIINSITLWETETSCARYKGR
jgi:6-pyruvoyltetrahydropterin/6-carboxytetrahydropterin synthase